MMAKGKKKPVRFEQALEDLEGLIEQIESGDVGLEESLAQYERGMKLIKQCREVLSKAEKKIAELTLDEQGRLDVPDGQGDE